MRRWYEDWEKLNPVLADGEVGEIIGMVQTKTGDGVSTWKELSFTPPTPESDSIPGLPTVRKFPFAFDTPDLLTGHTVYTPTVGDILLDAWVEVTELWDGTTPRGDFGALISGGGLLASTSAGAVSLDSGTSDNTGTTGAENLLVRTRYNSLLSMAQVNHGLTVSSPFIPILPARFATTDPIKVVVSQNGTNTGADPGSTQGSAVLYLVTVTPV